MKSTLASAIALYLLFADGEAGPEIYAVATRERQSKIIWDETGKMLQKSPKLSKLGRYLYSDILSDVNDGSFRALGRDSKALDGLNPSGALMDEIEAWTDMNMYDVIVDGTSARDNWFILLTSTAGSVRGSVWDNLYNDGKDQVNAYIKGTEIDDRVLFLVYELDKKAEWTDKKCWIKANPALGVIKDIEELQRKVEQAKRNPRNVNNLVMKDFNIPETDSEAFLTLEEIMNDTKMEWIEEKEQFKITEYIKSGNLVDERVEFIEPSYGVGGFDLSMTTDLTCATVMFQVPDDDKLYMKQMYWIPEDLLEERIHEDKVPYKHWRDRGLLRTCAGDQINHMDVNDWFMEMQNKYGIYMLHIGYDYWAANFVVEEMKNNFGKQTMEKVIQNAKTLSDPMNLLRSKLKGNKVVYNNNPIFQWCSTNVNAKIDNNGNIQPDKNKSSRARIDGFASALNAYVAYEKNKENYSTMIQQ